MFRRGILVFLLLLSNTVPIWAAEWQTDYSKALQMARTQNKRVLLDFTGSDWCSFCMALRKQVFASPAFRAYAEKNLILVEVDFPRRKQQSAGLKSQNEMLAKNYRIDDKGFPTIVLLDPAGKTIREFSGYEGANTAEVIAWIEGKKKM